MAGVPSGTVTLLFTDIQGSTRLWEDHAESMAPALERHDAILREAIESHGGYVFKTVGDAFCAAFASAGDAVAATGAAQLALQAEDWPTEAHLQVRMALHTGECRERDGDYFGPVVNRTARLEAIAHGGQVVLSQATAVLVRDALPDGWALVDLGAHRLKDLGREEQVEQLTVPGLPDGFPPLRSLDNPALANNLPAQSASFVGRVREVAEVRDLVKANRLVTLAGAGGAGKTRLALQVAAELLDGSGDGVWLVELAPVLDPDAVAGAVCQALGIADRPGESDLDALLDALEPQDVLIVLDNCEHLVDACARMADAVLRRCSRVHLVATSREPLGIGGETIYRVPSLSLPDRSEDDDAGDSDAVALFMGRVADQGVELSLDESTLPLVVSVCRRLDGMPLAIELAAARLRSMSLIDVHDRLDQRFRLLTGGSRSALPRQQTLRATVEWSYSLLDDAEQTVLRRLSWFVDGFDLTAAEAVCGFGDVDAFDVAGLLGSLVDKSLVMNESGRYRLLETIRQFSVERLVDRDESEAASIAAAHCAHYLTLLEEAAPHLTGFGQVEWLARLRLDHANLRRAIEHTTRDASDPTDAVRFAAALLLYWWVHDVDRVSDIFWLLLPVVEVTEDGDPATLVRARTSMALMGDRLAPPDRAEALAVDAESLARATGDRTALAMALCARCGNRWKRDDHAAGARFGSEAVALAREVDDDDLIATCLLFRLLCSDDDDPAESAALFDEAIRRAERCGNRVNAGQLQNNAANLALLVGDLESARTYLEQSLANVALVGGVDTIATGNLGMVELETGDPDAAGELLGSALRRSRRTGDLDEAMYLQLGLALVAAAREEHRRAAILLGTSESMRDRVGFSWQRLEAGKRAACIETLVDRLGTAEFDRLFAEGRALPLDDAFAMALDPTVAVSN